MKKLNILLASFLVTFLLVFGGCATVSATSTPAASPPTTTAPATVEALGTTPPLSSLMNSEVILENIYSQVNPSVVNINVRLKQTAISDIPGFSFSSPQQQYSQALGSGFVWDSAGDIVTNNHVVAGADNITVTFSDGTIVPGKVVGTDADSDLAVVKVDLPSDQIKPLQMADSSKLKVGQLAIAIGNPFGLQGTMTVGIISGLGRVLPANENTSGVTYSTPDIIQTDASLNPGNSGGVLLDDTGKVIGVTSSIATTSGTSSGVGFAIPSAIVQQVVPALIKTGHYDHPYLGLVLTSLTPDITGAMNLPSNQRGALVQSVTANGPSDKAGILGGQKQITINGQQIQIGGDIIIAYNGQTVKSSDDLVTFLARSGSAGQAVTLTVLRDGKQIQVQVTPGVRPTA